MRAMPFVRVPTYLILVLAASCVSRSAFDAPAPPEPVRPDRATQAPLPAKAKLTVQDAVRLALERSPNVADALARIEGARAALAAARAAFRPVVSMDVSYLYGNAPSAYLFKRIDARNLPRVVDFNHPGTFDNFEGGVTLNWNLWNGGRDRLAEWAAETGVEGASAGRRAVENGLVAGVVTAFLNARAAAEFRVADDASMKTVAAQVEEKRVRVEGGQALRSDLLSLQVRLAEAKAARIRTDVARRLALAALRRLMALPPGAEFEIVLSDVNLTGLPGTVAEGVAEAYRRRPELAAARRAVETARMQEERARRARLPRLDLQARWYGDDDALAFDSNATIGLALTFDIFDGGRKAAGIKAARSALRRVEEADRGALLQVAHEVEDAYLRLEEAQARLAVAEEAVGASEETLELVEKQYRGGSATITRYLDAEAARTRARTTRIAARLDVERTRVEVARALGRLGDPEESGR